MKDFEDGSQQSPNVPGLMANSISPEAVSNAHLCPSEEGTPQR